MFHRAIGNSHVALRDARGHAFILKSGVVRICFQTEGGPLLGVTAGLLFRHSLVLKLVDSSSRQCSPTLTNLLLHTLQFDFNKDILP
jgi:hypothetical protein